MVLFIGSDYCCSPHRKIFDLLFVVKIFSLLFCFFEQQTFAVTIAPLFSYYDDEEYLAM